MRLYGEEPHLIDQRRHVDGEDLAGEFQRLVRGALGELVAADIARPHPPARRNRRPPVCSASARRELEIFARIGRGLATREIAAQLGVSVHTPEPHREPIRGTLGSAHRCAVAARGAPSVDRARAYLSGAPRPRSVAAVAGA